MATVVLSSYSTGAGLHGYNCTGNPPGNTSDGCTNSGCHTDVIHNLILSPVLFDKATGNLVINHKYVDGRVYTLTIYVYNPNTSSYPRYGYQVSALNGLNQDIGNFLPNGSNHTTNANGNVLIEQSNPVASTGFYDTIRVDWASPSQISGPVTFHFAVLLANNDGTVNGDIDNIGYLQLNEQPASISTVTINNLKVYPIPCSENLFVSGLPTGNTNYEIYNIAGQKVSVGQLANKALDVAAVSTENLLPGSYFLLLKNNSLPVSAVSFVKQ